MEYALELNEAGYVVLVKNEGDPFDPGDQRGVIADYGIGWTMGGPVLVKMPGDRGILVGCSPDDANEQVIQLGWLRLAPVDFVDGRPTKIEVRTIDDQPMDWLDYPSAP